MDEARWALVKWIAAIVVMGGIVAYSIPGALEAFQAGVRFDDDDEAVAAEATETETGDAPPTEPAEPAPADPVDTAAIPTGPVANGNAVPQTDLSLSNGVVTGLDDEQLVIGEDAGDAIVLAFPLIAGNPQCVEAVRLEIQLNEATPTELGAYPSGLFDLAAAEEGQPPPGEPVLDQAAQSLAFTDGSPGRLQWDVTGLYRRWALAEPFQGEQRAPAGNPFVVTVRPTDSGAAPGRQLIFDAVESGGDAPTLSWVGTRGCE